MSTSSIATLFLIFNHKLTASQEKDAKASLNINYIVELPEKLKSLWSHIPPELSEVEEYIEPIKKWLSTSAIKNDYVLIQGDFGATYLMVNFAFEIGLIPIYATTQRQAFEKTEKDGSVKVTRQFKHITFRKYEKSK